MIDGRADKSRHNNLTWAKAQEVDIGSAQMAKEQAILNSIKSRESTVDLNQALKVRAAKYGSTLDPSHFRKGTDQSAEAMTGSDRRRTRVMLIGSTLFVFQARAHNTRKILKDGDQYTLTKMKSDT